MEHIVLGVLWYGVLLFSLTFHEAAHAWAALRGGDPTAYLGGQVSLDPRPHMRRERVGMVLAPLLFYAVGGWMIGWASTPFDPRWAATHPRRAAWMSLAGPAANALLVVTAGVVMRAGLAGGVFEPPATFHFSQLVAAAEPGPWQAAASVASLLFTLNLLLCVFNLLPLPPLDGSGAVGLLLPRAAARGLQETLSRPGFALTGILVAWFLLGRVFGPIFRLAVELLYPGLGTQ